MTNRKDRRRAAAVRRSAKPMDKSDRRQLISRILITVVAVFAAIVLFSIATGGR